MQGDECQNVSYVSKFTCSQCSIQARLDSSNTSKTDDDCNERRNKSRKWIGDFGFGRSTNTASRYFEILWTHNSQVRQLLRIQTHTGAADDKRHTHTSNFLATFIYLHSEHIYA